MMYVFCILGLDHCCGSACCRLLVVCVCFCSCFCMFVYDCLALLFSWFVLRVCLMLLLFLFYSLRLFFCAMCFFCGW